MAEEASVYTPQGRNRREERAGGKGGKGERKRAEEQPTHIPLANAEFAHVAMEKGDRHVPARSTPDDAG
jgi:hypothetical protein